METDNEKLSALSCAALELTELTNRLVSESKNLLSRIEETRSLTNISEATESVRALNQTVKTAIENLTALQNKYNLS